MFQYAVGRRLAIRLQTELKMDISWFRDKPTRRYSLGHFNIHGSVASPEEVTALRKPHHAFVTRLIYMVLPQMRKLAPSHIREKHFHFAPEILNLHDGVYLDGYWQSEKYFFEISPIIRSELTLKHPPSGRNLELSGLMKSCQSISIHVRRGDYASDPGISAFHGTCDRGYYASCVEYMAQRIESPHFFVFSDDPHWARANLPMSYPISFIEHNRGETDYEDLWLISQCKHHVIANSSFSWWGAWLNASKSKLVIAPGKWFRAILNEKDLIPVEWLRMEN
jgi:hypothetical protein